MYTLYIDTHSNKINIVLYKDKDIKVKKEIETKFDHSVNTMPLIIETLKEANIEVHDLNQILVVNGPGSFTGVRIGVTIAKTLSYTLNIPIKVLSSLLIKAISIEHKDNIDIVEREKNGIFIGTFDKGNNLAGDYQYISKKDINENINFMDEVIIDYKKIIEFSDSISSINPHSVNPLYVKQIEVQKW